MISEPQQEEATLYALGLLDAEEADAVERAVAADPELRALVRDLRESAFSLALLTDGVQSGPSPELKARVLESVATNQLGSNPALLQTLSARTPGTATTIVRMHFSWVPWAVAASLLGCLYWLGIRFSEEQSLHKKWEGTAKFLQQTRPRESQPMNALAEVAFCELEPTSALADQPHAAVLWDTLQSHGLLRVSKMPPPAVGKDYELWTIEDGRKDPIASGLVRLDASGNANIPFKPSESGGKRVVALAISLEKEGGSPTAQGPILLLGKL